MPPDDLGANASRGRLRGVTSEHEATRAREAERLRLTSAAVVCSLVATDPAGNITSDIPVLEPRPQVDVRLAELHRDSVARPSQTAYRYVPGGGRQTFTGFTASVSDPSQGEYAPHRQTRERLRRVSGTGEPVRYEFEAEDGSVEVYAQSDGTVTGYGKIFMTERIDPRGDKILFGYDSDLRLTQVVDALGRVTTLFYEHPTDIWKITKVQDPFGRFATFEYDTEGRLYRMTDVVGLAATFTYDATDTIQAMTTPYGTTSFALTIDGRRRYVDITDPLGGQERVEFDSESVGLPCNDPVDRVPQEPAGTTGLLFSGQNRWLCYRSTYHWDRRAMESHPGDYTKATQYLWLHDNGQWVTSGVLGSYKRPLENRVWYLYPNQLADTFTGTSDLPLRAGRVLDDGTSQISYFSRNARGAVIRSTGPLGRETVYVYGTGSTPDPDPATGRGLDLLEVRHKNASGGYDVLSSNTYDAHHRVLTSTDAAGQTTTYTYTPEGSIQTVTAPAHGGLSAAERTTTYEYYTDSAPTGAGQLHRVLGPTTAAGQAITTYEYDGYGRVWRVSDPEGYAVTTEYDTLDRPTRVTYPDGTYEETVYDKLDAVRRRDRAGRWTETHHDALRNVVAVRDPEGRTVQNSWGAPGCSSCTRGMMRALIDANGNMTSWEHDLQGRVASETRANGAQYTYTYENTSSRLKSVQDPNGNVKSYTYNLDNTLAGITYAPGPGVAATPNVSFTYDGAYNRVTTMTDGTGMTSYAYNPITAPAALGAGKLRSVDGPLDSDTITYGYDELGRVVERQIGSSANTQTQAFDGLGRLTTLTNPLGAFNYTYEGLSGRPASLTYPNGMEVTWAYNGNHGRPPSPADPQQAPRRGDAVEVRLHVRPSREHLHLETAGRQRPCKGLRVWLRQDRPAHRRHPEEHGPDADHPEAAILELRPRGEQDGRAERRRRHRSRLQQHEPAALPGCGRGARLQGDGQRTG